MKTPLYLLLAWLIFPAMLASAAEFRPTLDQTREVIAGARELRPIIPERAALATSYTLPMGRRNLMTEVPGKPFRQVDPPPMSWTLWKMPFYVTLGLPRDLIDGFMGGLAFVPFISILDYAVYEVVPTQALMRDPHDWHGWLGRRNKNGHAYYDGEWGWFPTAHAWKLKHPSAWKAKRNAAYNAKLQKELDELNAAADVANRNMAQSQQAAREAALEALQSGKSTDATGNAAGKAASDRMLPYYVTAQLDAGSFALLMASLATYEQSPRWEEELLWNELLSATQARLEPTKRLLEEMAGTYKVNLRVRRALILTDIGLGDVGDALDVAHDYLDPEPGKPMKNRLVFETAIAAGQLDQARLALDAMRQGNQFAADLPLMQDRLNLASGQAAAARAGLLARVKLSPGDAYTNYYLGIANLQVAQQGGQGFEAALDSAIAELQAAVAAAPGPILREEANQALSLANEIKSGVAKKPELTRPAPAQTPAAEQKQAPKRRFDLKFNK
ncbi:hypothetical protein LLG95_09830 [bacterium]|nr:hypothetical protein [bacterium]